MKANKNRKKIELRELVDPIKKFYRMNNSKEILYLIFDYPHKHYTFKYFEV